MLVLPRRFKWDLIEDFISEINPRDPGIGILIYSAPLLSSESSSSEILYSIRPITEVRGLT